MIRKRVDALTWRWQRNVLPYVTPRSAAPADIENFVAPTVAIHQEMRSGGNLLIRLFDGHPALNVRPYNFLAGRSSRRPFPKEWPTDAVIEGRKGPDLWREVVYDPRFHYFRTGGYVTKWGLNENKRPLHIDLDCRAYYAGMNKLLRGKVRPSTDDIVTATHAGYFAAWRNNANRAGPKKWTVIHYAAGDYDVSCENFLSTMRGGKIITLLRDPESQIASLHSLGAMGLPFDALVERQRDYLVRVLRFSKDAPKDRYRLVSFERLIADTEGVMRDLAAFLDIPFQDGMTLPTLNSDGGYEANTAFPGGTSSAPIDRRTIDRKAALDREQRRAVQRATADLYEQLQ